MKARMILSVVAASAVGFALAGEPIKFIGTGNGTGKGNVGDITNSAKWGDGATALSSECDYIIDNGKYCGFGGDGSFPGHSLTVGVVDGNKGYLEAMTTGGTFDFGTLILNNGQLYSGLGATLNIGGDVTVNATAAAPFAFRFKGQNNGIYNFTGDFTGTGNLRVYKSSQSGGYDYLLVRFRGGLSGFGGTLEVGLPSATSDSSDTTYRSPVLFGDTTIGGNLVMNPCGVIGPCGAGTDYYGEFSVENLSLGAGSSIRVSVNATTGGTIRVTQNLTLPESGKVWIDVRNMPSVNAAERRVPILVVPAGSGLSPNKFRVCNFPSTASVVGKLAACSLDVVTVGEIQTLYLVIGKYTYHKTGDTSGKSSWSSEYFADRWQDASSFGGTTFDADTTYVNYNKQMCTPDGGSGVVSVFGGKRLVVNSTSARIYFGSSARIDDLVMLDGSYLQMYPTSGCHLYGNITLSDPTEDGVSTVVFRTAVGRTANIDANISGSGNLTLTGVTTDNANCKAVFALNGDNSAFSGRLAVTNDRNTPLTNTTLTVSDVRALGGACSAFKYDALSLAKCSCLKVNGSIDFSEPTRGVYFSGSNYVNVANAVHTLTLASQTTLAGTLIKEGSGTLALGGTLKFTSAQSDMPLAGTNVLLVAAGRLAPKSKAGADGLAISFAAGTGITLAPFAETDADVLRYGLYDVKWTAPFDLTATGGKLDVALDLPADSDEIPASFSFGVCTVQSDAAGALVGNINLPSIGSRVLTIDPISNGDNTVTFRAVYAKRGFVVTVK